MKLSILSLLSIGLAYGLERPVTEEISSTPSRNTIDLSKVQPISSNQQAEPTEELNEAPTIRRAEAPTMIDKPWLGIMGETISDTLKTHLGIEHGLVLRYVDESSPAYAAGLRIHDILQSVNDQPITNQETLKTIIHTFAPQSEISIQAINKGILQKIPVTLASRPQIVTVEPDTKPSQNNSNQDLLERLLNTNEARESKPNTRRPRTRRSFGKVFDKLLKEVSPKNPFNLDFQSTSSISMVDEQGSVEVQTINGEKNVIVRDLSGNLEFEGPWNTEEEKNTAPENVRQRVENINFNYKSNKLKLSPEEIR